MTPIGSWSDKRWLMAKRVTKKSKTLKQTGFSRIKVRKTCGRMEARAMLLKMENILLKMALFIKDNG